MSITRIALIRPGQTNYDDQKRVLGTLEIPLNETGLAQMDEIAWTMSAYPLEAIYSAPEHPMRDSAERLAKRLSAPVIWQEGLQNQFLGLWQGLEHRDLVHKYTRSYRQWEENPFTVTPPNGETTNEVLERLQTRLARPMARRKNWGLILSEPAATLFKNSLLADSPVASSPLKLWTFENCGTVEILEVETSGGQRISKVIAANPAMKPVRNSVGSSGR